MTSTQVVMDLDGSLAEVTDLLAQLIKSGLVTDLRTVAPCDTETYEHCPVRLAAEHFCEARRAALR
jgi:hypothetical protein